jgi:hypothetical protein
MAPAVDSAAMAFFGYALIGLGPGIVFFCFFIASKSFVVLLAVFRWVDHRHLSILAAMPLHASRHPPRHPAAPSTGWWSCW